VASARIAGHPGLRAGIPDGHGRVRLHRRQIGAQTASPTVQCGRTSKKSMIPLERTDENRYIGVRSLGFEGRSKMSPAPCRGSHWRFEG
jgi:hypothetical protein